MSAQLTLDLAVRPDGPLVPVAREPISILWPTPEPEPLTPDERNERLARDVRLQEDIARWYRNREKALVDELMFLRSYVRAVAEHRDTFTHRAVGWQRTTPERDAWGIWRWVLDNAEANRVMEDSIMGPHRPPRPEPDPPPHDIREFAWDECQVYRHAEAGSWRIGWRGGDVCVLAPHPSSEPLCPPFWDIPSFPSRAKAQAELDRYRADVENVRREWQERGAGPGVADDTATEKPGPAHGDRVTRNDGGRARMCIDGPDAAGTPPISPERAAPDGLEGVAVLGWA